MKNKSRSIDFLGYSIPFHDINDISDTALANIQAKASHLYSATTGYTVAHAWVEATLQYLYDRGRQEASNSAISEIGPKGCGGDDHE